MNWKHALVRGAVGLSIVLSQPLMAQQAAPANQDILIICGDENGIYEKCTSIDDRYLRNHLILDMGHTVTMIPDTTDHAEMLAAANAADLVIIPESVLSYPMDTALVSTPTPVINLESFLQDNFGFALPDGISVDPGSPEGGAGGTIENPTGEVEVGHYGTFADQTDIIIVDPTHPLAAGLSGRVTVYSRPAQINWAILEAPGAQVVATLTDFPEAASIYYVPKGGELNDGSAAAGLRMTHFIENENEFGTYHRMTEEGHRLFDAAINWALLQE